MTLVFGSGATLDESGAIVPPSAVRDPAAPVSGEATPAETPGGVAAVSETDETPEAAPAEPTSPADEPPVVPTEADEAEGEEALVLPPTEKSQRRFVRDLLKKTAQQEQSLAQAQTQFAQQQQQIATLNTLLQQMYAQQQTPPVPPSPAPTPDAGPAVPASQPPQPESFGTHAEYLLALSQWSAEHAAQTAVAKYRAEQEALQKTQQEERETQARMAWEQDRQTRWQARMTEGQQQFADFGTVLANPAAAISYQVKPVVTETVLESPVGAAILYYLGAHPDVTAQLNQMGPLAAAKLMGVIEAHVSPRPEPETPPAPPVQRRPPALPPTPPPAPIAPVGGGQAPVAPTAFRPDMGLAAYTRMREAQRQTRR